MISYSVKDKIKPKNRLALGPDGKIWIIFEFSWEVLNRVKAIGNGIKFRELPNGQKYWELPFDKYSFVHQALPDFAISMDLIEAQLEYIKRYEELSQLKTNLNIDFEIDLKHPLRDFQKTGIAFMEYTNGVALIGDSMGTGKTFQAIAYAHKNNLKALVVCPAQVKINWGREVEKFTDRTFIILDGKSDSSVLNADFTIINYDILKKHVDNIMANDFDIIIADEIHFIKNSKSARTKALHDIKLHFPRRIGLTGTPLENRPIELFSILDFLEPGKWDWWNFATQYCDAHYVTMGKKKWLDTSGASNLKELHDKLNHLMIRRMKKDVLTELPEKQKTDIVVRLAPGEMRLYKKELAEYVDIYLGRLEAQKYIAEHKGETGEAEELQKKIVGVKKAEHLIKINKIKQLISSFKIKSVIQFTENIIEQNSKVIIFAQYLESIHKLKDYFGDQAVVLTGEMSKAEKQHSIDQFQENEDIKIFLGTLKAAGTGITLTAADKVIMMDLVWNPQIHAQGEDRSFRMGQKNAVNVYYFIAENTFDVDNKELLDWKENVTNQVIDGGVAVKKANKSVFGELMKRICGQTNDEEEPEIYEL
jgi:SWI/SNF-related matrix-associated actin-dependent regulator 1 of chromatin subfamily A